MKNRYAVIHRTNADIQTAEERLRRDCDLEIDLLLARLIKIKTKRERQQKQ